MPHAEGASVSDSIARTAIFGGLHPEVRDALLPYLEPLELAGGQTLCRQGEPSDALYVLCSGSLGAFGPGLSTDRERLLGVIAPGEIVGELGLLTEQPRSATVRALRDCTLLKLSRGDVLLRVMRAHPEALVGTLRQIVDRHLRNDRGESLSPARTFALLGLDASVRLRATAEQLAQALAPFGPAAVIDASLGRAGDAAWHSQREREHRFVLYVAGPDDPAWRATCLRQADQVVMVARADATPAPWPDAMCRSGVDTLHRARHLLLLDDRATPAAGNAARWLSQFDGEVALHHVRGPADHARVARHLAQRATGLVLSGGGARGFGHIGVVRALRELGQPIDAVGGTSMGAIIAAGVACEWDDAQLLEQMRQAFIRGHPLRDLTLPLIALTRGTRATRLLRRSFGSRDIEDLAIPFFCVSANLTRGSVDVHTRGSLWKWLRAGAAIPGLLPPLLDAGMVHVDGAVMNNLPTDVMRDRGVHQVIAVDISGDDALPATFEDVALPTLPRLTWEWLHGRQWPSLFAILVRAAMVQSERSSEERRKLATWVLTPPHGQVGLLNWKAYERAIESGYAYTMRHFETHGTAPAAMPSGAKRMRPSGA
ncbi:patatin-like phospholipase family protein [Thiomonas sp. FB-Cd]|uniref:patatin-like phospholipase family protein n=1 Tax=Thiomonas sp. FB-Cd TaxID=1158292 RepID=UPI000689D037|nr:patatin-like phospholipase family protein [Thiomonas sp. FB-Cd]